MSTDLTIRGNGFQPVAVATVTGLGGVTVGATTVVCEAELRVHVQVDPGTGSGVCQACATVA